MNPSADPRSRSAGKEPSDPPAAISSEGEFGGRLKALSISDVLEFLRVLNRRGVLVLRDGKKEACLLVREGRVLSATSSGEQGSLADFLLQEGTITGEQREAVADRERKEVRVTRALVELGVLSPRGLWEALRRQARTIVLDFFEWEQGDFRFREGQETLGTGIEADLPILDLIADGIRSVKKARLFEERMPSDQSIFEAIPTPERKIALQLEPHERYVLGLIDGGRSLAQVIQASDIGRAETLRVVFLLFSVGILKMKAFQPAEPEGAQEAEVLPLIRRYNEMFAFLHRYLSKEVGPIGEAVLARYFEEQKKTQSALLSEERLGRDGTLDEHILVRNLGSLGNGKRMERLIDSLNELLYAELLAVRRTLGPGHEGRAVQGLRELGLQPVTRIEPSLPGPGDN